MCIFQNGEKKRQNPEIPVHVGSIISFVPPPGLPQALFSPKKHVPGFLGHVPSGKRPFWGVFGARQKTIPGATSKTVIGNIGGAGERTNVRSV